MLAGRARSLLAIGRHAGSAHTLLATKLDAPSRKLSVNAYGNPAAAPATGETGVPETPATIVYAAFPIYKSKAALQIKPMKPKFKQSDKNNWVVDREGSFMLEFANSLGERRYDWSNKIQISLSPTELSTLVTAPDTEHKFYHDTFKGNQSRAGTVVKTLTWTPAPDGNAYFLNVYMTDKTEGTEKKTQSSCSLTQSEFNIFRQLVNTSLPALYGFDLALQTFIA